MNKQVRHLTVGILRLSTNINLVIMALDLSGIKRTSVQTLGKNIMPDINEMLIASKSLPIEDIKADDYYSSSLKTLDRDVAFLDSLLKDQEFLEKIKGIEKYIEQIKLALVELLNNLTK
ncbi:MAG: hypothetical protein HUJ68_04535 [Clostridia bacterium]|mgnify:CR=1 FL=1|nr:hypothetical protein [Clostridia bacterium]